ncbi:hypothetical protein PR202_gb10487 [Eleusine coracana subsp. coracana]|uniref:F-box domain-containing protein n=1 Tax=Eleusine coracana subsp. coracana TaxID=191504 RepID=A0AAV5EKI7_ELECO|nr:hypothetical protein PR202_gb10487 [Eleusine coracana subsp. coracana]
MEEPKTNPVASLTDDILVKILSFLPVRSVCRFKCVSRSWRNLISHPDYRKKLPQTLAGFFYESICGERFPMTARHFTNVTGKGIPFIFPSFSFLPVSCRDLVLLDCCDGLLLCRCFQPDPRVGGELPPFHYVVCNPATEKWVMLPDGSWASDDARTARLCFDRTGSSHFHVIEYVVDENENVTWVDIYSSKTGSWIPVENGWGDDVMLGYRRRSVFLNGFLHSVTFADAIVAVDMEDNSYTTENECGFIHRAQDHLCFIDVVDGDVFKLSIWTLDDHATNEWTLKHTVSTMRLFGGKRIRIDIGYQVIAMHPEVMVWEEEKEEIDEEAACHGRVDRKGLRAVRWWWVDSVLLSVPELWVASTREGLPTPVGA